MIIHILMFKDEVVGYSSHNPFSKDFICRPNKLGKRDYKLVIICLNFN